MFETDHRADTVGYALVEHIRLGRFDPERRASSASPRGRCGAGCTRARRCTLDDGRTVAPADLVGAPRAGRTRGLLRRHPARALTLIEAARGADLLVHEATFGGDEAERARRDRTLARPREAARVALEAGVRRLVLTHISPRYTRDAPELLAEAQAVFPETVIARDGMMVDVPFAE